MTKILFIPSTKKLDYNVDAYLIGVKNLSVNMPIYFDIDEIKNIKTDKEIYICVNKNMHSNDLKLLEDTLTKINNININGILFYDIGVLTMCKKLKIKHKLILAQDHMNNNYESINFWKQQGINMNYIPEEITAKEVINIKKHTTNEIITPILGYFPMFTSRRHLIENYLKKFNLEDDSKINYIEKEGKVYPIVDENVTTVYTCSYLNGIKEYVDYKKENIDYVLINSFLIEEEKIKNILNMLKTVNFLNLDEYFQKINSILNHNIDTFFLHKEAIYKVK